jgi:ubiquinone/menaquinone biosynthesis C-methylase UbiE
MGKTARPSLNGLSAEDSYFELQAYLGTTKHMGGFATTQELINLCRINAKSSVLDVGCGVGATACYIAETYGCPVVGVDLRESMVNQAQERAARKGLGELITFKVADATDLPFDNDIFDAVMCESVATFIEDKESVLNEFNRVVKPGGFVGLNEEIWLQMPTPEITESARFIWGIVPDIITAEKWKSLMENAGLIDVTSHIYRFDTRRESTQVKRYSFKDMMNMMSRTISLFFTDQHFRKYMKGRRRLPRKFFDHLGYGLTVGKRPVI